MASASRAPEKFKIYAKANTEVSSLSKFADVGYQQRPPHLALRMKYQLCPAGVSVLLLYESHFSITLLILGLDDMTVPSDSRAEKPCHIFLGVFSVTLLRNQNVVSVSLLPLLVVRMQTWPMLCMCHLHSLTGKD